MRAVQAYLNIDYRKLCAFKNTFDVIVWKLSVIRNKKLGFVTVLYIAERDKPLFEEVGLLRLYDEVNYIDDPRIDRIDLVRFWASVKFIAIEQEMKRGEPFFFMDTDMVFMDDSIVEALNTHRNLFWADIEPARNYPNLRFLARPKNFVLPRYFSLYTRPFNTAIIKIDNYDVYKEWFALAWRFMINNPVVPGADHKVEFGHMVTVEQRFCPNVLINRFEEEPSFFCKGKVVNFGKEHFHIWGMKTPIKKVRKVRREWTKTMLLIIKQESKKEYNNIIKHPDDSINDVLANWDNIRLAPTISHYLGNK